jgi:hypothetical protein
VLFVLMVLSNNGVLMTGGVSGEYLVIGLGLLREGSNMKGGVSGKCGVIIRDRGEFLNVNEDNE